jgi:hypothetical protein
MACANCGAVLTGPFCSMCGQKAIPPDLSVRDFLHETTQELTNWDGKIPRTLAALFLRPGLLTSDFLAGRRARWLSPLRIYLICSVAFFAGKPLIESVAIRAPRDMAQVSLRPDGSKAPLTAEERQRIAEGLPGRIFGVERLERAAVDPGPLNREIESAFSKAMFVLLPLFALLTNIAWRGARPRYPSHLYLALHLHSLFFGAALIVWLLIGFAPELMVRAIAPAFVTYLAWYGATAFKRVFGESWPRTLVKTLLVAVVYEFFFLATALALLGFAVTRM